MDTTTETRTIRHGEREYVVQPFSYELQAKYTAWLKQEARSEVRRQRPFYQSDVEYREDVSVWQQDCAAHAYDFKSAAWYKSLGSDAGAKQALLLCLQKADPTVTTDEVDALYAAAKPECERVMDWAINGPFGPSPTPAPS